MKKIIFGCLLLIVILTGCSEEKKIVTEKKWEVSPTFAIPTTFNDGTKGEYAFIGEQGKLGILVGSGKVGDVKVSPFVKGEPQKFMWHFLGGNEEFNGKFKVIGINGNGEEHKVLINTSGTDKNEKVWEYSKIGISPNNGADTHIPSDLEFPTSGLWKLDVYIGDKLFGDIIVKVE
ncbi:DUF4871 domain-containing protein [Viridibacillus sp. NPDC096237]|uniref:DUF4871 domain-containing protein n=1 Tax=Viridibacillus sp. NPDC096237 TaxID=3390721 RepID=UPI003D02F3F7